MQRILMLSVMVVLISCSGRNQGSDKRPENTAQFALTYDSAIPLDSTHVGEKQFLLMQASKAPKNSKTLEGFWGRQEQWAVVEDSGDFVKAAESTRSKQFSGLYKLSETSPNGAMTDPSLRVFNLPELLDRLLLEGKIDEEYLDVYPASETDLLVIVHKPTLIAASFSQGRRVKFINRSHLVLIAPLAEGIEITQGRASQDDPEPVTSVYSSVCVRYYYASEGTFERLKLGEYLNDGQQGCDVLDGSPVGTKPVEVKSASLDLQDWMPQVLVSSIVRNESILSVALRWRSLYPLSVFH